MFYWYHLYFFITRAIILLFLIPVVYFTHRSYLITLSGVLEYRNMNNVSRERSDVDTWMFHLWRATLPWHFSLRFSLLKLDRSAEMNILSSFTQISCHFITFFLLWSIKADISIHGEFLLGTWCEYMMTEFTFSWEWTIQYTQCIRCLN